MAKGKKKKEHEEGWTSDDAVQTSEAWTEEKPQLTSEMIEEEKPMEEVSGNIESEYERHPKFSKFKGEKK